jgi:hypothetical protein
MSAIMHYFLYSAVVLLIQHLQKSENIKGRQKEDGIKPKFEGISLAYKWLILNVLLRVWIVLGSMKMVLNSTKNLRKQHMIAKFFDV